MMNSSKRQKASVVGPAAFKDRHRKIAALSWLLLAALMNRALSGEDSITNTNEPEIRLLIERFNDQHQDARRAVHLLTLYGRVAVPALIRALKDTNDLICLNATVTLGRIGADAADAVPDLISILESRSADSRPIEALGLIGAPAVPALTRIFTNHIPEVRANAARALRRVGRDAADAVPVLMAALKDEDERVRHAAVDALGSIGPEAAMAVPALLEFKGRQGAISEDWPFFTLTSIGPRGVPLLVDGLQNTNRRTRWKAVQVLQRLGPDAHPAVAALRLALSDTDSDVCRGAMVALGAIGPRAAEAIPDIRAALDDESEYVRGDAVRALQTIAAKDAILDLIRALGDESPKVRWQAIKSLQEIGPDAKKAVPGLIKLIADLDVGVESLVALERIHPEANEVPALIHELSHTNSEVRWRVAAVLGSMGREAATAVPNLVSALTDRHSAVRLNAARALGKIGPDAKPGLIDLVAAFGDDDKDVRWEAGLALALIGQDAKGAVPALVQALGENDNRIRKVAALALSRIGPDHKAIPALIRALEDTDYDVRSDAADALGKIGSEAVPALVKALKNGDPEVRHNAAKALAKIGDQGSIDDLIAALQDISPLVRSYAAMALGKSGPAAAKAVDSLFKSLKEDTDDSVRRDAAFALGRIGAGAKSAVPGLIDALKDRGLRTQAMASLGGIGRDSLLAVPQLNELLKEPDVRWYASRALGQIASAIQSSGTAEDRKAIALLENALRAMTAAQARQEDLEAVRGAIRTLKQLRRAWWLSAAGLLSFIVVLTAASGKARRWIGAKLGRRWQFVTGTCDHLIRIGAFETRVNLTLQSYGAATSNVLGKTLSADAWPPPRDIVDSLQIAFRPKENVRIEVADAVCDRTWNRVIGTGWAAGQKAVVAGQVVIRSQQPDFRLVFHKNVSFAGIACPAPRGCQGVLANADLEVREVARTFKVWGANVITKESKSAHTNATVEDLKYALKSADIVHVAAHATAEEIHMTDGTFSVDSLRRLGKTLRCRLLVLSACNAGDLGGANASLVYQLVNRDVNVIASVKPARDSVCDMFFRQMYSALLPNRRSTGVPLGDGIRSASEACHRYFANAKDSPAERDWRPSLDNFMLCGDPTLQLQFRMPPRNNGKERRT